jgi:hypothetical protein
LKPEKKGGRKMKKYLFAIFIIIIFVFTSGVCFSVEPEKVGNVFFVSVKVVPKLELMTETFKPVKDPMEIKGLENSAKEGKCVLEVKIPHPQSNKMPPDRLYLYFCECVNPTCKLVGGVQRCCPPTCF